MKKIVAVLGVLFGCVIPYGAVISAAKAEPPVQFDGGIVNWKTLSIVADDGTHGDIRAESYGTTPGYLEFDAYAEFTRGIYVPGITLSSDSAKLSWPTGYGALGFDPGASSLGTIFVYTPYSLHVTYTVDAGMLLEKGQPVVLGHGGTSLAIETFVDQFSSGTKALNFTAAFSSAAVVCTCSDTDAPMTGCGPVSVSASAVTFSGDSSDHFNGICVGPR